MCTFCVWGEFINNSSLYGIHTYITVNVWISSLSWLSPTEQNQKHFKRRYLRKTQCLKKRGIKFDIITSQNEGFWEKVCKRLGIQKPKQIGFWNVMDYRRYVVHLSAFRDSFKTLILIKLLIKPEIINGHCLSSVAASRNDHDSSPVTGQQSRNWWRWRRIFTTS